MTEREELLDLLHRHAVPIPRDFRRLVLSVLRATPEPPAPEPRETLDAERLWNVLAGKIQSRWFADDITTMDLQEMASVVATEYERAAPESREAGT